MEWSELVARTAEAAGCTLDEATRLLMAFSTVLTQSLEQEDKVALHPGVGAFVVKESGGEPLSQHRPQITKRQRTVMFKASNDLKKRMRQSDEDYLAMLERLGAWKQVEQLRRAEAKKEYSA